MRSSRGCKYAPGSNHESLRISYIGAGYEKRKRLGRRRNLGNIGSKAAIVGMGERAILELS